MALNRNEWLAKQPWSNGNIGMWDFAATGGSQLQAAATATAHPYMQAILPVIEWR